MNRIQLVILCLCFFQATQAQVSVAVSGGLNSTILYSQDSESFNFDRLQSYYVGISPVIGKKKVRLRLGLQGSYKGTIFDNNNGSDSSIRGFYADFVPEIEFRPIRLVGFAVGGNVGINLNEQGRQNSDWKDSSIDLFRTTDYGLRAAARLYLWRISFEVAYNHGLAGAFEYNRTDANGTTVITEDTYFRGVQIGMAYRFGKN